MPPSQLLTLLREWLERESGPSRDSGVEYADTLKSSPLDRAFRRRYLKQPSEWIVLEKGGEFFYLAGIEPQPQDPRLYVIVEYDADDVFSFGEWYRHSAGNWQCISRESNIGI